MKFRKKPVEIDAEQFLITNFKNMNEVVNYCNRLGVEIYNPFEGSVAFQIRTLEGIMEVKDGDWVITGVVGEKYPCRNDIFERTYEPVNE